MKHRPRRQLTDTVLTGPGLIVATALALGACKPQEFSGRTYQTGPQRSDGNGTREDELRNSAFPDAGTDNGTLGNQAGKTPVPPATTGDLVNGGSGVQLDQGDTSAPDSPIPALRVCSNRYSEDARTNLRMSEAGAAVTLVPSGASPAGQAIHFHTPEIAQRVRADIMNLGQFTLPLQRVPGGSYQMIICDARYTAGCTGAAPSTGLSARFGGTPGVIASAMVQIQRGRLSTLSGAFVRDRQAIEVLTDRNIEQQAMMQTFFNVFSQAAAQGGAQPQPVFAQADLRGIEDCDRSSSPLILDLGNRGIALSPPFPGTAFDIDADGRPDRISWPVSDATPFLVLDRDGDGTIDDGSELFGDNTPVNAGGKAANGFAALADHDADRNGVIDSRDPVWEALRLWADDGDGRTQPGELRTLAAAGLESIDLAYVDGRESDLYGNTTRQRSTFRLQSGQLRLIVDLWFRKL